MRCHARKLARSADPANPACSVEIADMPPKKRDRCIKEVHLLQQLSHPNIITMFDAFVDQDQLVIITEWAPGGALRPCWL
jgi:serine/threonine protein kinase